MALKDLFNSLMLAALPRIYALLAGIIFGTCSISFKGPGAQDFAVKERSGPYVYVFWHYGVFYYPKVFKGISAVAMVSASKDGELIARVLEYYGIRTVRGSRNQDGLRALKGLITTIRKTGKNAGVVADGSQGPALVAQPGAVLLASMTGNPVVPLAWAAEKYTAFSSWDKTVLPHPFSKITVWVGEPLGIPSGIRDAKIEEFRKEVEARLLHAYQMAWQDFGRLGHGTG